MEFCIGSAGIDWPFTKDVFSIIGVVFSAIGISVASYVGLRGLSTWSKTVRGQDEHKLARQMLVELYQFHKLLERYRSPRIHHSEAPLDEAPPSKAGKDAYFDRLTLGFERRLDALNASYALIAASLFEAQALWGEHVLNFASQLEFLKDEYEEYVRLKLLCWDPREPDDEKEDHRMHLEIRRVVFKNMLGVADDFGAELTDVVRKLEALLKSKLLK